MDQQTPPAPRREVSITGRLFGLSIMGSAVMFIIVMEGFGPPEIIANAKYILLGALAASIALPMLFFRRTVREG